MAPSSESTQEFGNKRVAQVMALLFAIAGGFVAYAYSVTAAIVVWVLAVIFLVGSFFIERNI